MKKVVKFKRYAVLSEDLELVAYNQGELSNVDIKMTAYSRSGDKMAQLVIVADGKDKKTYIRIHDNVTNLHVKTVEVSALKKHGAVHAAGIP